MSAEWGCENRFQTRTNTLMYKLSHVSSRDKDQLDNLGLLGVPVCYIHRNKSSLKPDKIESKVIWEPPSSNICDRPARVCI